MNKLPLNTLLKVLVASTITFPTYALACASCGCTLSSDAAMGYSSAPGFRISLQYDYVNQDRLRHGSGTVSQSLVATIPDQEVENKTTNQYVTLGLGYAPNASWDFKLLVPYIDREHSTYGSNPTLPLTTDQLSSAKVASLGDMKVIAAFQGFLPTHNLGIEFGVKLPTGNYGGTNASDQAVGHHPVYFGTSGNAGGEVLDTSLQAGTGSTDIIVGGYYYQAVSQDFDAFVSGEFQSAVAQQLDQQDADYRPGNQANLSMGLRYMANPKIIPQIQVNLNHRSADQGALADTANSAGTVAYLSPGISARIMDKAQLYGFVQLPVYRKLDGYQLAPKWMASVGLSYGF
jgi:hypothetical protein